MDELGNEKVNMIYAETYGGQSSLKWWGAPLEFICPGRHPALWCAIHLHHSSSVYCPPIWEWQVSRGHLYTFNLTSAHRPLKHIKIEIFSGAVTGEISWHWNATRILPQKPRWRFRFDLEQRWLEWTVSIIFLSAQTVDMMKSDTWYDLSLNKKKLWYF